MTDLSKTIAGGSLSPDQAPSSSPPGPFGASSTTALSFGARWTPATSAQSPGPSGHSVPRISPRSGILDVSCHSNPRPQHLHISSYGGHESPQMSPYENGGCYTLALGRALSGSPLTALCFCQQLYYCIAPRGVLVLSAAWVVDHRTMGLVCSDRV